MKCRLERASIKQEPTYQSNNYLYDEGAEPNQEKTFAKPCIPEKKTCTISTET